ncbi:MAG: hypothetical protein KDA88_06560 [Planctomycetaceae bacterium]|nr:hypothetical protein [Planctomycetaceae bacterium]MCB9953010.1 hypothetical protein [Planctomycetaceae bacterium]
MRQFLMIASLVLLFATGCDLAAYRQRAENAQRDQTVQDLQELGESMHNEANEEVGANEER